MAANELSFNQIATVLNSVVKQATGQTAEVATDTSTFVTQATTALKTGYDPFLNALSQTLTRTIFSIRPYESKFKGLEYSESQWGNHVRKVKMSTRDFSDDLAYKWPVAYETGQDPESGNGKTVDMYTINKPDAVQTNFYGKNVYGDHFTVFEDQLECATTPDGFGRLISMIMTNSTNMLELARENIKRVTVANLIGAIIDEGTANRVVHLVSEYNAQSGITEPLTSTTVFQPQNFKAFTQWAFARINNVSDLMTEYTNMFQTNLTGHNILQSTPKRDQKAYILSPYQRQMEYMAIADVYHNNILNTTDAELVNFWQSIQTPDSINITPGYVGADGVLKKGSAVAKSNVFGVLFDREAAGVAYTGQKMRPTPLNAAGSYANFWIRETERNFNDLTEKAVVFLLD